MSQSTIKSCLKDILPILPSVIIFLAASVAECAVIFPIMTEDYINYDSSYQYALTQHTLPEIFELLPYDYSPPFYAVALKLFTMVFGNSLPVMRAFSMVAVVGMFFIAAFPVRTLFGSWSAGICVVITFCSTIVLDLLHEIRPTIFGMFFFMAAAVYAVAAYRLEKKYAYICMTVFAVLCTYTHNISLVGMVCVYGVLLTVCLIRKEWGKFRSFLISGVICAVLFIPWLGVILTQISNVGDHFWETPFNTLDAVKWVFSDIFLSKSGSLVTVFNFALWTGLFFVLVRHVRLKQLKSAKRLKDIVAPAAEKSVYFDILLLILFILAAFISLGVINLLFRNLASQRYYAIIGTVWIVALSAILGRLGSRICGVILSVTLIVSHCSNVNIIIQDLDRCAEKDMVAEIRAACSDGDIAFLHTHELTLGTMAYYFPDATHYVCDQMFTVLGTFDVFPVKVVEIGDYHNIWEYTDTCIVFENDWGLFVDDEFSNEEIFDDLAENNEAVSLGSYNMGYSVSCKSFDISRITHIE